MRVKQSGLLREWSRWLALIIGISVAALLVLVAKPAQGAGAAEKAKSADAFVDTIGVNTHIGYRDTVYHSSWETVIKPKLQALGARHIRDAAFLSNDQIFNDLVYGRYKELAALPTPIKSNLIVDPRYDDPNNMRSINSQEVARIAEMAGPSLEALEGPNEYNLTGEPNWPQTLRNYQKDLYEAAKSNGSTANVPVLGPSPGTSSDRDRMGDLSAYLDYGTTHPYPGGNMPSDWSLDNYNLSFVKTVSGTKPLMATETGYHTAPQDSCAGHPGVSEKAAGKYLPRVYFEYFERDIARTYSYELIDQFSDPNGEECEYNFGLLRNDGSEKPAYKALKNLIGLLEDPGGSFNPGSLSYSLSGDTENVNHTLLQKRDGRFYLVLWQEVTSYNLGANRDVSVPTKQVNLTLDRQVGKAATYLPNDSASSTRRFTDTNQLTLDVPDQLLVVELEPSDSGGGTDECASGQYLAEYFGNPILEGTPTIERCEDDVDNDWGIAEGPGTGMGTDDFSARWTGTHDFEAGEHTFTVTADDGVRIWVDEEPVIDEWQDQSATTYTATREMTAGEHEVRVEYYENWGDAVTRVAWEKTGEVDNAPEIEIGRPEPDSKTRSRTPRITATVRDDQTDLAKSDITLSMDGGAITDFDYDPATDRVMYKGESLSPGKHTVEITARDAGGLSNTRSWSFKVKNR